MSERNQKNERIYQDMTTMINTKYKDKYFVHRVIRFLRDNPERVLDYEDFVPDWKTRVLEE